MLAFHGMAGALPKALQELKSRVVFRALAGYGVFVFAVLQVIEPVMHGLHWPDVVLTWTVAALLAGFPLISLGAWLADRSAARTPALVVLIAAVAALPALAWYVHAQRQPAAAPPPSPSIAVLPFLNLSPDRSQDYFSDGVAEQILDTLAQVPGLQVCGCTSSFSFKGKNEDLRSIGEKLGVANILEGSVRNSGKRVRVTAQLVSVASGFRLWSETFDRELTDIFAIQDDIARAVADALRLKLLPAEGAAQRSSSAEAYAAYLRARQALHASMDGWDEAVRELQRAVELDAGFAPAWASFATALALRSDQEADAALAEVDVRRAGEAADRAVALAPHQPEGFAARGFVRATYRWEWTEALADLSMALQLAPSDAETRRTYGLLLFSLQRREEGVAALRRAAQDDPLSGVAWYSLARALLDRRDLPGARAALARAAAISGNGPYIEHLFCLSDLLSNRAADALGRIVDADRENGKVVSRAGLYCAAIGLYGRGEVHAGDEALHDLARLHRGMAYQVAQLHGWRGETDAALEWLEISRARHDGGVMRAAVDPMLEKLHGDPRYQRLLQELKLPAPP